MWVDLESGWSRASGGWSHLISSTEQWVVPMGGWNQQVGGARQRVGPSNGCSRAVGGAMNEMKGEKWAVGGADGWVEPRCGRSLAQPAGGDRWQPPSPPPSVFFLSGGCFSCSCFYYKYLSVI